MRALSAQKGHQRDSRAARTGRSAQSRPLALHSVLRPPKTSPLPLEVASQHGQTALHIQLREPLHPPKLRQPCLQRGLALCSLSCPQLQPGLVRLQQQRTCENSLQKLSEKAQLPQKVRRFFRLLQFLLQSLSSRLRGVARKKLRQELCEKHSHARGMLRIFSFCQ